MNTIRQTWRVWVALLLGGATGQGTAAKSTDNPGAISYSAFKPIAERNIFDQNRSVRAPRPVAAKTPRAESFGLTGTLDSEKGPYAFFDGTSSAYRKVLKPEGTIAGYKVTAIEPNVVTLEDGDKKLELRVGTQLTREGEDEWKVAATSVAYASSSGRKGNSSSSSSHNSKSDSRKKSSSKHKHSGTPDSGQYSKKEISAILKEEKRALAEELKDYPQEESQDMKYVMNKPVKKGRRKKSR
jgi:hypothetical protein